MTDIEMANGCRKGERKAQRELYEKYSQRLYTTILRYEPDRDIAQDVLQEAMIKAYTSFNQFEWRGEGSLEKWLRRLSVNMALNMLRGKRKEQREDLEKVAAEEIAEPTSDEVERIPHSKIMEMIGALPAGYRTIFNLYCIEGYSHKEISEILGINEKSSSSQLHRAKALLAKRIKAYIKETGDERE